MRVRRRLAKVRSAVRRPLGCSCSRKIVILVILAVAGQRIGVGRRLFWPRPQQRRACTGRAQLWSKAHVTHVVQHTAARTASRRPASLRAPGAPSKAYLCQWHGSYCQYIVLYSNAACRTRTVQGCTVKGSTICGSTVAAVCPLSVACHGAPRSCATS